MNIDFEGVEWWSHMETICRGPL